MTKKTTKAAAGMTVNPVAPKVTIPANIADADMTPAQRALGHFQTIPADLLVAMATGKIDPLALAMDELASRGLDPVRGGWIGFEAAAAAVAELKAARNVRALPASRVTAGGVVERLTNGPRGPVYVTVPE